MALCGGRGGQDPKMLRGRKIALIERADQSLGTRARTRSAQSLVVQSNRIFQDLLRVTKMNSVLKNRPLGLRVSRKAS